MLEGGSQVWRPRWAESPTRSADGVDGCAVVCAWEMREGGRTSGGEGLRFYVRRRGRFNGS